MWTLVPTEVEPNADPTPEPTRAQATPKPGVAPAAARPRPYTVKRGDTLSGIASRLRDDVAGVRRSSTGIDDPRSLRVGQVLKLP